MDIKFLGTGSTFNFKENTTSSFVLSSDSTKLLLIDAPESITQKLVHLRLLENVKEVYVVITQMYPDYISGLGKLALYTYYNKHYKIRIVDTPYNDSIEKYMSLQSIDRDYYSFYSKKEIPDICTICLVQGTNNSLSFIFKSLIDNETIYYSNNTLDITTIKSALEICNRVYLGVSSIEEDGRLYFEDLLNGVERSHRNRIYCTGIDKDSYIDIYKMHGLNVVQRISIHTLDIT